MLFTAKTKGANTGITNCITFKKWKHKGSVEMRSCNSKVEVHTAKYAGNMITQITLGVRPYQECLPSIPASLRSLGSDKLPPFRYFPSEPFQLIPCFTHLPLTFYHSSPCFTALKGSIWSSIKASHCRHYEQVPWAFAPQCFNFIINIVNFGAMGT